MNAHKLFNKLSRLSGLWTGRGRGQFPTIQPFDYEECLTIEVNKTYPIVHYEQRTKLLANQLPSHWESGFIRVLEDELIEISNAQDSGRVEILKGKASSCLDKNCRLELESVALVNDPRLISTKRIFQLTSEGLEYYTFMSTKTTTNPIMLPHLHATLKKAK